MKDTPIPVYNYTFAKTEEEAISKVRLKWGEYDRDIRAKELSQKETDEIVISTNIF
jgi:hypothetical protein